MRHLRGGGDGIVDVEGTLGRAGQSRGPVPHSPSTQVYLGK